jgi:hypothetical protein
MGIWQITKNMTLLNHGAAFGKGFLIESLLDNFSRRSFPERRALNRQALVQRFPEMKSSTNSGRCLLPRQLVLLEVLFWRFVTKNRFLKRESVTP